MLITASVDMVNRKKFALFNVTARTPIPIVFKHFLSETLFVITIICSMLLTMFASPFGTVFTHLFGMV